VAGVDELFELFTAAVFELADVGSCTQAVAVALV